MTEREGEGEGDQRYNLWKQKIQDINFDRNLCDLKIYQKKTVSGLQAHPMCNPRKITRLRIHSLSAWLFSTD